MTSLRTPLAVAIVVLAALLLALVFDGPVDVLMSATLLAALAFSGCAKRSRRVARPHAAYI